MSDHNTTKKQSRVVGLSFSHWEYKEIERRAKELHMSKAGFLKVILRQFFKSKGKILIEEE